VSLCSHGGGRRRYVYILMAIILLVVGGLLLIFLTVQFGFFGISADTFRQLPMVWMIIALGVLLLAPVTWSA